MDDLVRRVENLETIVNLQREQLDYLFDDVVVPLVRSALMALEGNPDATREHLPELLDSIGHYPRGPD